jgi:Putative peptidoglycan binding domain/Transglycosylase SLT domain
MKTIMSIPVFGCHSNDTIILQTELVNLGFNSGIVDGVFGNQTKKAIQLFQKSKGLVADGIIGKKTLTALDFKYLTPINANGYYQLSWENKHPENAAWSNYIFDLIDGTLFDDKFSLCEDLLEFRPDYNDLNRKQKISVWGELISAICLFESSWIPTSWMVEKTMDKDPVTGIQVKSEGLMQLSYQDKKSYASLPCRLDWNADKLLDQNDTSKTIFNPLINLEFGINILAYQIFKFKKIALIKNVYWAVLRKTGKSSRIIEITQMIQNLTF